MQFSDSHISNRTKDTSYKSLTLSKDILQDAIYQTNQLKDIDFVFHTGDSVDSPKDELIDEFICYMNGLKSPWYLTFGNHDISINGDITKEYYIQKLKKGNKNFDFEKPYYSFSPKRDFKVIALDSIITTKITGNGRISEEEKLWLKNEIAKTPKDTMILIFLHVPIKEPFSSPHHKMENQAEIEALLKSFNRPIAVFNGHYHTTKIQKDGKILYASAPALVGFPYAFRIVNINNSRKKVVFKFDYAYSGVEKLQNKNPKNISAVSLYLGGTKDREGIVEIEK